MLTCKFDEDLNKTTKLSIEQADILKLFRHTRASYSKVNNSIWPNLELSPRLYLWWLPGSLTNIRSKSKELSTGEKLIYGLFRHSRAGNNKLNIQIRPKFETLCLWWLPASLMKIRIKEAIHRIRWNMEFFITQGQVTPKEIFRSGLNSNFTETLCL